MIVSFFASQVHQKQIKSKIPNSSRRTPGVSEFSGAGGIRTHKHLILSQVAHLWRTAPFLATHTGFEPVISAVTGQRPLQAGPMGQGNIL